MKFVKKHKKRWIAILILLTIAFVFFWFSLPKKLFSDSHSTVLYDQKGQLLAAHISDDEQWRFPYNDNIPEKFEHAVLTFEDQEFYQHPGVNPLALGRATLQNIRNKRVVSGGSTVSMQVIRLSRKGKSRTLGEKFIEMALAVRLEIRYTKKEILAYWCSYAPFGGNVVGLEAACWRYYGRSPEQLSWGEAATLAVLPNAPSLIFPGKNHELLRAKRNRLLDRMLDRGILDTLSCSLAKDEPLPQKPKPLKILTPHLLSKVYSKQKGTAIHTTIDANLQHRCNEILNHHMQQWIANKVYNAAAIVVRVEDGAVISYVGNSAAIDGLKHGNDVDIIRSQRSSGSILKPLLFAAKLDDGTLLPDMLIPDVPLYMQGYQPTNFNQSFDGAVPASQALTRSLNIPAVKMLQDYGVNRFLDFLHRVGITGMQYTSDHYGLSLILGGAEVSLWELADIYSSFARVLNRYNEHEFQYSQSDWKQIHYNQKESREPEQSLEPTVISASAIWSTFESLLEVNRPNDYGSWRSFSSSKLIAWKTGTSYGYRDAWAVGTTPEYVVAVWVGNASGEGRKGLMGAYAAAPLMFEIFNILPETKWFEIPENELLNIEVCSKSGYKASPLCKETEMQKVPFNGNKTKLCPYHQQVFLDPSKQFQVNSNCMSVNEMVEESYFVLPSVMAWYYRKKNPWYQDLPPIHPQCSDGVEQNPIAFIYPSGKGKFYLPKQMDGKHSEMVFQAAHQDKEAYLHWHLDETFLGSTQGAHKMLLKPESGLHRIILIDDKGNRLERVIEVI